MSGFVRQSISILLAVLLVFGFMSVSAYAADNDQVSGENAGQEESLTNDDSGSVSSDDSTNAESDGKDTQDDTSGSSSSSAEEQKDSDSPSSSSIGAESKNQSGAANSIATLSEGNVLRMHGGKISGEDLNNQLHALFGGGAETIYGYRAAESNDEWISMIDALTKDEIDFDDGFSYEVARLKVTVLPPFAKWVECGSFTVQSYWNANVSVTGSVEGGIVQILNNDETGDPIRNGGSIEVNYDDTVSFKAIEVEGYKITSLTVDGKVYDDPTASFELSELEKDINISVTYEADVAATFKVDVSNAEVKLNGDVVDSGSTTTVNANADTTIAIDPIDSYAVEGITVKNETNGKEFVADSIVFNDGVASVTLPKDFYSVNDICTVSAEVVKYGLVLNEGNLQVPCMGLSDTSEIEKRIFETIINVEGSYPSMSMENVAIQYDAGGMSGWQSIGYDPDSIASFLGAHAFGENGNFEKIRISYNGNEQYLSASIEAEIELVDSRPATILTLNEGVSVKYASEEEMKESLFNSLIASLTAEDGSYIPYDMDDFEFSFSRELGEQEVDVTYKGIEISDTNTGYQPCSKTAKVTVTKGTASVSVDSKSITYGEEVGELVTASPEDCMPITIIAGINGSGEGYISIDFSSITLNDITGKDFSLGNQSLQKYFIRGCWVMNLALASSKKR